MKQQNTSLLTSRERSNFIHEYDSQNSSIISSKHSRGGLVRLSRELFHNGIQKFLDLLGSLPPKEILLPVCGIVFGTKLSYSYFGAFLSAIYFLVAAALFALYLYFEGQKLLSKQRRLQQTNTSANSSYSSSFQRLHTSMNSQQQQPPLPPPQKLTTPIISQQQTTNNFGVPQVSPILSPLSSSSNENLRKRQQPLQQQDFQTQKGGKEKPSENVNMMMMMNNSISLSREGIEEEIAEKIRDEASLDYYLQASGTINGSFTTGQLETSPNNNTQTQQPPQASNTTTLATTTTTAAAATTTNTMIVLPITSYSHAPQVQEKSGNDSKNATGGGNIKAIDSPEYYQAASQKLRSLGITDPSAMQRYTERLRKWLVKTVLVPIAKKFQEAESVCISSKESSQFPSEFTAKLSQIAPPQFRLYLNVPGCSSIAYIVDRIKTLSSQSFLGNYEWDKSGGTNTNSADLPTDAQIIAYVFETFLDILLPDNNYSNNGNFGRPFSSRHVVVTPDKPDPGKVTSVPVLFERRIRPTHFEVAADGEIWEVTPGRNNLFHAIILFVLAIKTTCHGHVGPISLSSPSINLVQSLEGEGDILGAREKGRFSYY